MSSACSCASWTSPIWMASADMASLVCSVSTSSSSSERTLLSVRTYLTEYEMIAITMQMAPT
eukprot:7338328-Prymnesium_polylepis.1